MTCTTHLGWFIIMGHLNIPLVIKKTVFRSLPLSPQKFNESRKFDVNNFDSLMTEEMNRRKEMPRQ
jgi:hypothetical protein